MHRTGHVPSSNTRLLLGRVALCSLLLFVLAGGVGQAQAAGITLVQHIGKDAGTTTTSTLSFTSPNTTGNFIAVVIRGGLSNAQVFTVKDSNANVYKQAKQIGSSGSQVTSAIYYAENIVGGANTITVTMTVSGPLRFALLEYSGVATSNSLDVTVAASTTSTSPNSGNLTTTTNGDLLLGEVATADSTTFTGGAGFTVRDIVPAEPSTKLITEDQIQAIAGTAAATATLNPSSNWATLLAAFKPAGGVAGSPTTITASAGTPQSATVGTAFAIQLQATVKDSLNNPVSGATVTFAAPGSGASGTFAGGVNTASTNASGVATSAVFTANSIPGSYTVTAAVSGVASPANFSLTNLAGPAASIVASAGTPQSVPVNTAFGTQFQVTVKDSLNNPVSGVTVTFTAPSSGASGTFAGGVNTATTNASGLATAAVFTANTTSGSYIVTASVSGVASPANFSLINLTGPLASITATAGTPQSATINTAFGTQLQATVKDPFNNPVTGAFVTFTVPSSGASGTFIGGVNTATTNASGVATAAVFTANNIAGSYTVSATVSGVASPANFSLTNLAGAAASITATAGTPQSATTNTAFAAQLQATVKDSSNNPVSGVLVTFTVPGSGASGTFAGGVNTAITNALGVATAAVLTANSIAGSYTVTATVSGVASPASFSLTNVAPQPTITGLNPASGPVGTSVTITGANFGATQGTSTVTFNGTPASPSSWSNTSITAQVPSGTTSGNVVVTVGGVQSNGVLFTIAPPVITFLGPTSGGFQTPVMISGDGFGFSQGSSTVSFAGTLATPTSWGMTSITVPVPRGATSGNVVVTVGGLPSNGVNFTVLPISVSVSPASPTIVTNQSVGYTATVQGDTANLGVTWILAGAGCSGSACGTLGPATSNQTTLYTAPGTVPNPPTVTITATSVADPTKSATSTVTIVAAAPHITGLSPVSGPINTLVTIAGSGFGASQLGSTVAFNGVQASATSWSDTSIVTVVPASATTGNVVVTVGGAPSNGVAFTVTPPNPHISTLTPSSGQVGASVTIAGTGFSSTQGSSFVAFNGSVSPPTSWSDTSIVAPVPFGATSGNVVVRVGGVDSNGVNFSVTPNVLPTISSVSPNSGVVGLPVTISGSNFGASQGASSVTFNGTAATPSSWSATSIVVPVPAGATTGNVVVTVGGQASNGIPFTVTVGPLVSALSPTSGPAGSSVTITGTGFGATQGTSSLNIGSISATVTSWSDTSIVAVVPSGLDPYNNVGVSVVVSGVRSNTLIFGIVPSITGLSPAAGAVGTSVTITGNNFGSSQGSSTVTFNGTPATPTSWNPTSIVVPVPAGATTGNVVVTASGFASNGVLFTMPPSITSLSRTSGAVGYVVTITGTNFGATQGTSTVTFNGTAATPTSWSNTSIAVLVPNGATTGNVVVTVSGAASNGLAFTVLPTPNIANISPGGAPVGASVTITGTNFGASQGTSIINFNSTQATPTSWSPTSITVLVPAGAFSGNVVVFVNGIPSNAAPFTVAPTITNVFPNSGTVGDSISIPGTNFGTLAPGDTVTFNGTPATIQIWIDTGATVLVPAGATTGPVVATVGGFPGNSFNFTVTPITITSLNPASGLAGTSVTITGTNFGASQGTSTVTFNGVAATPTSWSQTSIVVPVPVGAVTGNVTVTVAGNISNAVPFTVTSPNISSLTPNNGPVGSSITISGANFGASQGTSTVTFNGVAATPTSWSPSSIVVPVPAGAATGNVVVTVGGMATNGVNFFVTPKITGLSPSSGPIGTVITLSGSNFGATQGSSTVLFGGLLDAPTSWSDTSIGGLTPPNLSAGPAGISVTVGGFSSNGVVFQITPGITSLSPTSGPVGTSVTITGSTFGGTQGTSTVTFNGVPATPTSWSNFSIIVPVPSGATTGNVVVNVAGQASSGVPFTVTAPVANIALVQHIGKDAGTTTTTTLAFNSANTAGNFIAVAIRGGLSNSQVFTVKDSNSNTYKQAKQISSSGSAVTSAIYYAENIKSGANTITVTMTVSGPLRIDILEYSGVATSNSLDATAAATTTSTSPNTGSLTTTANGDLLLAMVSTADSTTFTVGSGYTIRDFVPVEPNTKLITEDQIQATAGTTSATATLNPSSNWGAILAAFKAAGGTGGGAGTPASITATAGTPQSATVNTAFAGQFQATVRDSLNNPVSGVTVTFTVPASGASGGFAGLVNTATTNASGVATSAVFTGNSIAGSYTVTASVSGVHIPANFSLTNLAGSAANIITIAGTPQSAVDNAAFATNLQASVRDSFNNPVSGVTVTFTAPASGAGGTFAGGVNTAITNASGVATAPVFTANGVAGSYTVTASSPGVGTIASFSLTNLSGPPASVTATGGTPQSATVNTGFTNGLQVTVRDASNSPVSNVTVTFTVPASGASGTFAGGLTTALTDTAGHAMLGIFTANAVAGSYTVTASVAGVATPANFSLTNLPGPAANIFASAGTLQNAAINSAFATPLQATVTDSQHNPVSGVTVTFTAPAIGASGTFAGITNTAITNAQGIATAPTFTANTTVGPYTVTASASGVSGQASFSLTNLSSLSNITLVQHRNIDASTQTNNSLAFANNTSTGNFIAVAIRGSGSSSQVFTVIDSSSNTYHQAFSVGLTASAETFAIFYAENINGGPDKITVTQSVLGTLRFAILEYSGVATSNSLDGTATAQGTSASPNSGNVTTTANGDLLLATIITKNSGTYTATGNYNIEETVQPAPNTKIVAEDQLQAAAGTTSAGVSLGASDIWGAGLAAFRSVSGAVAPISVSVSPTSASIPAGYGTQAFTAAANNDFLNRGVNWSLSGAGCSGSACGTLSRVTTTSVLYTAPSNIPSPAIVTLTATSIGDSTKSASATVTVTQGVLTVVVTPKRAAITLSSAPVQFTSNVYNDAQNLGVTWQVDGNNGGTAASGTISTTGLYTPGTQPGLHTITAVSNANASVSGSALMAVTDLAGVYTNHNDNARTGQNLQEYGLTTATVTPSTFGQLFSCPVDGYVYAQPLWVANLNFSGVAHNVVFIATEHDSVYAFDADSPNCVQLWQTNFLSSGVTTLTMADVNSNTDIVPEIGITSTPVIDPATNTLYVVPKTRETVGTVNGQACSSASPCYVHRLHALDLITGAEKFGGPVVISAASFSAQKHLQRPALLLSNNTVYLAFGSHGDQCNYQGWLMGYNAGTLAQTFATAVSNPTSGCNQGSIWQSGGGPSADASGNVYVVTANGLYDGTSNFGDTVVKLNSTGSMPPADWFTPFNQATLAANDVDLGSAAILILPDAVGSAAHPHLAITTGKDAVVYLLDQTSMGKFNSSSNNDVQELVPVPPANTTLDDGGNYVGPAYWNGNIYLTGQNYPLMQFQIANGVIATPQFASSSNTFPPRGGAPVVSANGATGGIVWIIDYSGFQDNTPAILDAYDANNVGTLLFSSPASGTGAAGNGVKFTVPTVANAKVYVGGQFVFTVYGLLPN